MDNATLALIITGALTIVTLFVSAGKVIAKAKEVVTLLDAVIGAVEDMKVTAEELADIKVKLAAVLKKAK